MSLLILCKISNDKRGSYIEAISFHPHAFSSLERKAQLFFAHLLLFVGAYQKCTKMIYWKLMIIGSNVTVGAPREFGLLGGIR